MKNLLLLCLSVVFLFSMGYSQDKCLSENQTQNNSIQKELIQKSVKPWTVQNYGVLSKKCITPLGFVSDGSYFYAGSYSQNIIYKINFSNQLVDSFAITGMPGKSKSKFNGMMMEGLAYDGTYFYMCHSTDTIYKIDLTTKSVVGFIPLPTETNAMGVAYAPDADGGNGGFWVSVYNEYSLKLVSKTGTLLSTITSTDLGYEGESMIWGLAYDTISEGGPYLYALEDVPQYIIKINPATKKIVAPIHNIMDDVPDTWSGYGSYGISIQRGIVGSTVSLAVFFYTSNFIQYDLSSTILPDVAMEIVGTNLKPYYEVGKPITIKTNVYNSGINEISSYHYNYKINDKTFTLVVTGANIVDVYPRTELTHDSLFTPITNDLVYTVKVWISEINGDAALHTDTFSTTFHSYTTTTQRTVLHEVFTSSTCSPCKNGNYVLDTNVLLINPGKYACIKYQMSWPSTGDPYYTDEGGVRRAYYDVGSVPYLAVDGNYYNANPASYTSELLNTEYIVPSFVNLSSTLDFNGLNTFKAKVTINPLLTFSGTNKLYVALVEKKTKKNKKSNKEEEFHYVFKKFMTSADGQAITLTKDVPQDINLTYIFNGSYRLPSNAKDTIIDHSKENSVEEMTDIIVVYWIQNSTTKEVLQSGSSEQVLSVNEYKSANVDAIIYPNPSQGNVTISSSSPINTVKVYNLLGQEITSIPNVASSECNLNTASFKSGFYLVQIETKDGVITRKLNVK